MVPACRVVGGCRYRGARGGLRGGLARCCHRTVLYCHDGVDERTSSCCRCEVCRFAPRRRRMCVCVCACDRRPACACVPRPDTSDTRASRDAAPCAGMVLVGMPPGAGRATPCSTVWTGYMYHDICRSTYTTTLTSIVNLVRLYRQSVFLLLCTDYSLHCYSLLYNPTQHSDLGRGTFIHGLSILLRCVL